ncbi:FAD-dependent oxidoreductase [Erythrobacter aurantius]|uniref:FAD-dependent oxidoreductase n=1 Tax=Erythrobacter aurantius TaxID=2909249 RepID=UPI00207A6603|nr:FAD-dependent oxidoreductase [Erythrobacter aurantius]
MSKPRFIVVGGGLIGVTTLYELVSRGYDAALFEAEEDLALGASFANGGMLTPSMPDPWNGPGVARHLFASLFDPRSSMKLHLSQVPSLFSWGLKFLAGSGRARHEAATLANYRLCARSLDRTRALTKELGLEFDQSDRGTLKVFESEAAMAGPLALAQRLAQEELRFEKLDAAATVAREPLLAPIADRIAGALYFPDDGVGDARKFVLALAEKARELGAAINLGARVNDLILREGRICGIVQDGKEHLGEVVLCTGVWSPELAAQLGQSIPVKPAKGYSLSVDARALGNRMPRVPVIDDAMHAAVVPLGDRLRFVGTAEFAGFNQEIDQVRIDNLISLFERLYPDLEGSIDLSDAKPWTGLRPMSASGQPIIRQSAKEGLWLNCGHGHLGWTMACGSAEQIVDLIYEKAYRP